ncbi:MAG: prolyl aminopeptidase [Ramlibacter sp.]
MSTSCPADERSPHRAGGLPVGDGHVLAWQERGPTDGVPVLLLHGGPGSATSQRLLELVDTGMLRLVAFDQRGCGGSTPRGATDANTTSHLLRDIEALRLHLGIGSWLVIGGSWGATLALAYASGFPKAVRGLLMRNLFVPSAAELHWFFQGSARHRPAAWQRFASMAPAQARADLLGWLADVFAAGHAPTVEHAARAWLEWERALAGSPVAPAPTAAELPALVDRYRIQAHYLRHACWLDAAQLSAAAKAVPPVPVLFLHGAQDVVCRPEPALALQRVVPGSLWWMVDGGHDPFHPPMAAALRHALDEFACTATFGSRQDRA